MSAAGAQSAGANDMPAIAATSSTRCSSLVEPVDLRADHLAQTLRDLDRDFGGRSPQAPRAAIALHEPALHEMLQHCDHEQRIALGVAMEQQREFLRHVGRRLSPAAQILRDLGLGERLQHDLPAQMSRDKIALERVQRLRRARDVRRPIRARRS